MLLKKEFNKAMNTVYHLTHNVAVEPRRSAVVDDVFNAVVAFVHNSNEQRDGDRTATEAANALLASATEQLSLDARNFTDKNAQGKGAVELTRLSDMQLVRQYQQTLAMQAQAYTALLGTGSSFALSCGLRLTDLCLANRFR